MFALPLYRCIGHTCMEISFEEIRGIARKRGVYMDRIAVARFVCPVFKAVSLTTCVGGKRFRSVLEQTTIYR